MATIATAAAGNWSAPATWAGGVVPGSGDTATIGHAVTVDVPTINLAALTFTSITGVMNVGASLNLTVAGAITMTASSTTVSYGLNITAAAGQTVNIVAGGLIRGIGANRTIHCAGGAAVNITATGTLAGPATGTGGTLWVASSTMVTISGNVDMATAANSSAIIITAADATVHINGSLIVSGTSNAGYGIRVQAANATIQITGTLIALSAGHSPILVEATPATITVGGAVTAGTASPAIAVSSNAFVAHVMVHGGMSTAAAIPAVNAPAGSLDVAGTITASAAGQLPFTVDTVRLIAGETAAMVIPDETGTFQTVSNAAIGGEPAEADVRAGTAYRGGNIGTMAVPPRSAVRAGIPVGNRAGVASVSLSDLAEVTGQQLAAAIGRN